VNDQKNVIVRRALRDQELIFFKTFYGVSGRISDAATFTLLQPLSTPSVRWTVWSNRGGDGNESLSSLSLLKKIVEAWGVSGTRSNLGEKSACHAGGAGNGAVND
jgi:hypothetical protein